MTDAKQQNTPELKFTVLGPSGAGKTTLLACMYNEFDDMRSGMMVPDAKTSKILQNSYTKLRNAANDTSSKGFGTAIGATEGMREFKFTIKGKSTEIPIYFYDFPGGWMDPDNEHYEEVIGIARDSIAILVAVNTPYLMEEGGMHAEDGLSSWTIQNVITKSYTGKDKLVLLVPIKCEKYTRTPSATREMRERMKDRGIFKKTVGLLNNPSYENLSMAILPVHTVGNAEFARFRKDDSGKLKGEIYRKTNGIFNPKNTDQPFRFVMSFILNEIAKSIAAQSSGSSNGSAAGSAIGGALAGAAVGSFIPIIGTTMGAVIGGIWGAISGSGSKDDSAARINEFIELGEFIRSGMKLDDPDFEIIGGRANLEAIPIEEIKSLVASKESGSQSSPHDTAAAAGLTKEVIISVTKKHGFTSPGATKSNFGVPEDAVVYTDYIWWRLPFKFSAMFFCSDRIYWQSGNSATEYLTYDDLRNSPNISLSWLQNKFKDFPERDNVILTLMELRNY